MVKRNKDMRRITGRIFRDELANSSERFMHVVTHVEIRYVSRPPASSVCN